MFDLNNNSADKVLGPHLSTLCTEKKKGFCLFLSSTIASMFEAVHNQRHLLITDGQYKVSTS